MKNKLVQLFAVLALLYSCENKEDIIYTINFSLSQNAVKTGDTIALHMDWGNSSVEKNIQVNAFEINSTSNPISVPIIELNPENDLVIKIPYGLKPESELEIVHSNGATARNHIYKKYFPVVKDIYPLSGTGGEIITIEGIEFLSGYDIQVGVNTMLCEIIESSDSVLKCKIPIGCGSGRVKIYYWEYESLYPGIEFNIGIFDYQWLNQNTNQNVISYTIDGNVWDLERDNNRVWKRTLRKHGMGTDYSYVEYYSYGTNGLVDTIFHSTNNSGESYSTIVRSSDNTIIQVTLYNRDNTVINTRDFFFHNGLISNIDYYDPRIQATKTTSDQYRFHEDTLFVTKTYFNESAGITSSSESSMVVDNFNGEFPDIGIPGYHHMFDHLFLNISYTYPKVRPNYGTYMVKYNEFGNLLEWTNLTDYGSLRPFTIVSFQYE